MSKYKSLERLKFLKSKVDEFQEEMNDNLKLCVDYLESRTGLLSAIIDELENDLLNSMGDNESVSINKTNSYNLPQEQLNYVPDSGVTQNTVTYNSVMIPWETFDKNHPIVKKKYYTLGETPYFKYVVNREKSTVRKIDRRTGKFVSNEERTGRYIETFVNTEEGEQAFKKLKKTMNNGRWYRHWRSVDGYPNNKYPNREYLNKQTASHFDAYYTGDC